MKQIDILNLKIQKFIDVLLCIASIVMLAVNLAQVIFRYIFHASIFYKTQVNAKKTRVFSSPGCHFGQALRAC